MSCYSIANQWNKLKYKNDKIFTRFILIMHELADVYGKALSIQTKLAVGRINKYIFTISALFAFAYI